MLAVAARIVHGMCSMRISTLFVCSALIEARQSPLAPPCVCHACHRIELYRCLLRWSIDKEALPATKHAFIVLGAGSGATETA
jgi:coenzyme F420-reducing hydrogenase delta subunit